MGRFYLVVSLLLLSTAAVAQKADAALVVGGSFVSDSNANVSIGAIPVVSGNIKTDHHLFYEGALGVRLLNAQVVALYAELPVAGIPSQGISVASIPGALDHISTIFVTPGVRLKVAPISPISPWVSIGGGWARYSLKSASLSENKAALEYGGGLDFKTGLPLLGFRAEVRDFVTGNTDFGLGTIFTSTSGLHHHNVLVGGGLVLRF